MNWSTLFNALIQNCFQPQSHSLLLEMVFGHAVAQRVSGHFEEPTGF
jgi:hypothetical protein